MGANKKNKPLKLTAGRPPAARRPKSISRKATRALINAHHVLEKRRAQAVASGDKSNAEAVTAEISALGGLEKYQQASLQGQRCERGGDSSKVLLEWLRPKVSNGISSARKPRMLEVGALSTRNACSTSGLFDMEHIDLKSQEQGIKEQDFMKRPLPSDDSERFDVISLSLVLNFNPSASSRGEMLRRTTAFLRDKRADHIVSPNDPFPAVYLVLPRPCVSNSRYFTEARLAELMSVLGFSHSASKLTQKLIYSLWKLERITAGRRRVFPKKEVNPGAKRNNFTITLEGSPQ